MHLAVEAIIAHGQSVESSRGPNAELRGVLLEIDDPRDRISHTESRGKIFSCLGELCWYLARANDLAFIEYYVPRYKADAENGVLRGAYGPRLLGWDRANQIDTVTTLLKARPASRQAVMQLFDADDLAEDHANIPCTCTLQFMIRDGRLHMLTHMRSNDVYLGLPHDVFCFTMLQEILARSLSIEIGSYKHFVGSLHLYEEHRSAATEFLTEGWQSAGPMPPMPVKDPWPAIDILIRLEHRIRSNEALEGSEFESLDAYWQDLVRLLEVFAASKNRDRDRILVLKDAMQSQVYTPLIEARLVIS